MLRVAFFLKTVFLLGKNHCLAMGYAPMEAIAQSAHRRRSQLPQKTNSSVDTILLYSYAID
ncbi:hypothetical protein [Nostoc sp. UHCC 0252]|uniref:hypothetical protein n=1 Tax=Nostoc sp. UHCC 0252 TaxID=3110241 RepID=UPI002B219FD9|nr:hypothetical protein [Nostoc sp. UHCC 0252]MEA5600199.1 hypothetical protein [Nostoc sp. UHCC 0252]